MTGKFTCPECTEIEAENKRLAEGLDNSYACIQDFADATNRDFTASETAIRVISVAIVHQETIQSAREKIK